MKPFPAQFLVRDPPPKGLWLLPVLLILAALGLSVESSRLSARIQALQAEMTRLGSLQGARTNDLGYTAPPYEDSARTMLSVRAGPWSILRALEASECHGVLLSVFDYSAENAEAALSFEAADYPSVIGCLKTLNAGMELAPAEERWRLVDTQQLADRIVFRVMVFRSVDLPRRMPGG